MSSLDGTSQYYSKGRIPSLEERTGRPLPTGKFLITVVNDGSEFHLFIDNVEVTPQHMADFTIAAIGIET